MDMLRKFLRAVSRDWGSRITGAASIPLTVLALWADTPLQRWAWAVFAITCLLVALFRIWVFEYRRAEDAEVKLKTPPRPWLIIDRYSSETFEDEETGQEGVWETIHVVNRGQAPAVSIVIPEIHLAGRRTRLLRPLPTLGPGESTDAAISNLYQTLAYGLSKVPLTHSKDPRILRIPLIIEYHDLDHRRWTTEHAVSYSVFGISFEVIHPNEVQEWTDLSFLEKQPTSV
jgi:hypothetical protein